MLVGGIRCFLLVCSYKIRERGSKSVRFRQISLIIEASIEVDCNCLVMSAFFPASFGRQISKLGEFAF
jgi:uncharacterized membrane-anchored protein